ncbi:hypothetical protein ACFSF2_05835, partial [Paenibacillus rhizophilus]|uniref:hypothetical protein n=1 Tax=Paenibacillus rhizophilus TaxID=1850366 RepID=UPI00363CC8C5
SKNTPKSEAEASKSMPNTFRGPGHGRGKTQVSFRFQFSGSKNSVECSSSSCGKQKLLSAFGDAENLMYAFA